MFWCPKKDNHLLILYFFNTVTPCFTCCSFTSSDESLFSNIINWGGSYRRGKRVLPLYQQAMEYIANAENKFTDLIHLETGCIKIGISTTLIKEFLLLYLEKFHSLYPKINIQIITNFTSDLISKLKKWFC